VRKTNIRHVSLRHALLRSHPRDKCTHTRAFPGIISARKVFLEELLTYVNPRLVVERCANARACKAAERHENASPGSALKTECVTGIATDGFA